jgi:hypothetical protein
MPRIAARVLAFTSFETNRRERRRHDLPEKDRKRKLVYVRSVLLFVRDGFCFAGMSFHHKVGGKNNTHWGRYIGPLKVSPAAAPSKLDEHSHWKRKRSSGVPVDNSSKLDIWKTTAPSLAAQFVETLIFAKCDGAPYLAVPIRRNLMRQRPYLAVRCRNGFQWRPPLAFFLGS